MAVAVVITQRHTTRARDAENAGVENAGAICMDVKPRHWLITVCTPSALHGTTVFGVFLSVAGVRALNLFSFFSVKQCQLHIWLISKKLFWQKISPSESNVLKTFAYLKRNQCNALRSKYGLCPYDGTNSRDKTCGRLFENVSVALTVWFYFFVLAIFVFFRVLRFMFLILVVCRFMFYGFNVLCIYLCVACVA